jgi:uncharacterized membrane protein YozB (DUF420 family)
MVSFFVAQIDLVLQLSIFILLIGGIVVQRRRKITAHARLMLVAVILNLVSFAAIMAPAWDNVGEGGAGGLSTAAMLHVTFGGLAMLSSFWVLGTWLVPTLLFQNAKMRCYGKLNKRVMTAVTLLWLAAIVAGFILFLMVNTTLLGTYPLASEGFN